jgi:hypothetical protein
MKNLFSVNKAADLLEKDRQTLVRALRHVKPDGYERGHPRYTLKTITDALAVHQGGGEGVSRDLQPMFDELDQRYRAVQNAPTLAERRQQARVFFSFVVEVEGAMYADAKRRGEDLRMAQLRIAEHTRVNVLTLRDALDWNSDEAWAEFMKADRRVCDGAA